MLPVILALWSPDFPHRQAFRPACAAVQLTARLSYRKFRAMSIPLVPGREEKFSADDCELFIVVLEYLITDKIASEWLSLNSRRVGVKNG